MENKPLEIRTAIAYYGILDKSKYIFTKNCFEDLVKTFKEYKYTLTVLKDFDHSQLPLGIVKNLEILDNALVATIQVKNDKLIDSLMDNHIIRPSFIIEKTPLEISNNPSKDIVLNKIRLICLGVIEKFRDIYNKEDL